MKDDIEDALERVMLLKKLKLDPYAQPFRSFAQNSHPDTLTKDFARWVNDKPAFKTCDWEDYVARGRGKGMQVRAARTAREEGRQKVPPCYGC